VGAEYLVLWLGVETQTTPIGEGCGMDFFHFRILMVKRRARTRRVTLKLFAVEKKRLNEQDACAHTQPCIAMPPCPAL
jgi:hypothetical protein